MTFQENLLLLIVYCLDERSCTLPKLYNSHENHILWCSVLCCGLGGGGVTYVDNLAACTMNLVMLQMVICHYKYIE